MFIVHLTLLLLLLTDASPLAAPLSEAGLALFTLSGGLISEALVTGLIRVGVLFGLLFGWARLRPKDIGLLPSRLVQAGVVIAVLWLALQMSGAAISYLASGTITLDNFPLFAPAAFAGEMLETVISAALLEEVAYRGFLMSQLYLLTTKWWPGTTSHLEHRRLLFAVLVPQILFGINHVPTRLDMDPGLLGIYIIQVVLMGVFFAALYLVTHNLFVAVGVHALVNNPASLVASPIDASLIALVSASLLLIFWPQLAKGWGTMHLMLRQIVDERRAIALAPTTS